MIAKKLKVEGVCEKVMEGCVSVKRKEVKSGRMERIMKEENDLDRNAQGEAVEGPVVCVSREEVLHAINKNRKSPWTFRSIIRDDCC